MLPTQTTPKKQDLADLTVLAYGRSKIGKSTWCSRSEGALFLATEPGLNALDVYQVPIQSWDELLAACGEIAEGKHPFKTIIVDNPTPPPRRWTPLRSTGSTPPRRSRPPGRTGRERPGSTTSKSRW